MRYFLQKLILFLGVFFFCFISIFFLVSILIRQEVSGLKLKKDVNTLVLGDSHIKLAIDDHIFSGSVNFAQHSEPYMFTYQKLEILLTRNPQIRKVYLGFGYQNLSSIYDSAVVGSATINISSQYFYLMPVNFKALILKNKFYDIPFWSKTLKMGFEFLSGDRRKTFLGGYENKFTSGYFDSISIKKRIKFHFYDKDAIRPFSEENILYLKRIIELCRNNHIELTLLKTPVHSLYMSGVPQIYINRYDEIFHATTLRLIDFKDIKLTDNDFVQDGDHLSSLGARKVSSYLSAL